MSQCLKYMAIFGVDMYFFRLHYVSLRHALRSNRLLQIHWIREVERASAHARNPVVPASFYAYTAATGSLLSVLLLLPGADAVVVVRIAHFQSSKRQKCHFQFGLAMPFQFVSTINIWACAVNYIRRTLSINTHRTVLPLPLLPPSTITITVIKVKDSFLYFYRYWLLKHTNRTLFLQKRNSFNAKKLLYCWHYSSSNSFCSLFLFSHARALTLYHIAIAISILSISFSHFELLIHRSQMRWTDALVDWWLLLLQ